MKKYDVLVIGSGLSSLTCASLLAKRGLSVIVVEQGSSPGGSCGSIRLMGRTIDIGTSMFFGFGTTGFNPHYFVMNELEEPIDVIKHSSMYRLYYENTPILFHSNIEEYFSQLETLFPSHMEGIRAFYTYIEDIYTNVIAKDSSYMAPTEMKMSDMFKGGIQHPIKNLRIIPLLFKSAKDILIKFVESEEVIQFFSKLTSTYCYTTLEETPAILAITMFMENHIGGAYYTPGGSFQLPGKIEKAIETYGGTILYNTKAKQLIINKTTVMGAKVEDAHKEYTIEADAVVYGGTLLQLETKLIPSIYQKQKKIDHVKSLTMTYPSVIFYAIVDKESLPKELLPVQMYAPNGKELGEDEITLYIPSLGDPSLCNEDEHILMIIGPTFRIWPQREEEKLYSIEKDILKKRFLILLDSLFTNISTHIRYVKVATPRTIERFTFKEMGYVAGPKQAMGQELLRRQKAKGEYTNLYHCGEATVMGTGSVAVTISGISATNMILRKKKLQEYRRNEYKENVVHLIGNTVNTRRVDNENRTIPTLNSITDPKHISAHDKASKCQWCLHSPCTSVCPAFYDIKSIMRKLECGNIIGAKHQLPSPLACLTCPSLCEDVCTAKKIYSTSVEIKNILLETIKL